MQVLFNLPYMAIASPGGEGGGGGGGGGLSIKFIVARTNYLVLLCHPFSQLVYILNSRKFWWGIKFGSLVVYVTIAKLKSAKISYSDIYVWRSRTELPNLNILAIVIWARLNRQI